MHRWLVFALVVGCGNEHHDKPDAAVVIDAPRDAPADVALDAALDAPIDAPIDANLGSPRCATTPTVLLDADPRRITTMANVGNVLYVGVYNPSVATDVAVLILDPATGAPLASPLVPAAGVAVWPASDAAYAAEGRTGGSIWRLVPGQSPVELVTGRASPFVVTSDGAYVYWSEKNPTANQPELIMRRAIAGGAVEQVMTGCANPYRIVVDATDLYCVEFQSGTVLHAPKDGSAVAQIVPYSGSTGGGYPVATMIEDGANLYLANLYNNPQVWGAAKPSGPFTVITQSPDLGRYLGLAATASYFYAVDNSRWVIDRIDRSTHTVLSIPASDTTFAGPTKDPIIWKDQLYFIAQNPQTSGDRLVMHCID